MAYITSALLNYWTSGIFQQSVKFKNCAQITGRPGFSNILTHPCEITGRPVFFREKKTLKHTNNCEKFLDVWDLQTLLPILVKLLDVRYTYPATRKTFTPTQNSEKITEHPGFSNILTHPCEITGRPVYFSRNLKRKL